MTTYTEISEFTTVVLAQRRQGPGWETFTIYRDAETAFVSFHATHATREDAEARALRLIAKLVR